METDMPHVAYEEQPYGFHWGAMTVHRLTVVGAKRQAQYLGVDTAKTKLTICCTRTGKLRVFNERGKELK